MAQAQQQDRLANYVPVAERVANFYHDWPNGRILTAIIEHDQEKGFVLMRAEVYRELGEVTPSATGHAYELKAEGHVNRTSYIENCETGAVGRALANLDYETKRGAHAAQQQARPVPVARMPAGVAQENRPRILNISEVKDPEAKAVDDLITPEQSRRVGEEAAKIRVDAESECLRVFKLKVHELSREAAAAFIKHLMSGAPERWA